jgi:hypothetical protein
MWHTIYILCALLPSRRRMNVALTRARTSLWVVCHAATLRGSTPWEALLQHAQAHGLLLPVQVRERVHGLLCTPCW